MKTAVVANWVKLNTPLEGKLPWMYLDAIGLVTTGMGNRIDPIGEALPLPWVNPDGSPATMQQISDAWYAVDAQRSDPKGERQTSGLATKYGGAFAGVTSIRLTDAGIAQLVAGKLSANEVMLRTYYPGWDSFPADGQFAISSMAWAMGAGFPKTFTSFTAKVNAGDWAGAIADADFQGIGVSQRIAMNKAMLANAAAVAAGQGDPEVLYWPGAPSGGGLWHKLAMLAIVGTGAGAAAAYWRPGLWKAVERWLLT